MSAPLLTNLPKLRWYRVALTSNVLVPYLLIYWTTVGLSLAQTGVVLYFMYGLAAALEIHAGYFADRWSHKASLALGGLLGTVSSIIFATTTSLGWILLGACLFAAAQSFSSGADSALARASCSEAGQPEAYERFEGYLSGDIHLAEALGSLLAMGLVILFGLKAPFWGQVGSFLAMFLIASTLKEAHESRRQTQKHSATLKDTLFGLRRRGQLMAAIVFSAALGATLTVISILAPLYYQSVQAHNHQLPTVKWFGLLWCGYLLAGWGFSRLRRRFARIFGPYGTMGVITVITLVCYTTMALSHSWTGLLVITGLLLAKPIQQAHLTVYTQKLAAPNESATIMSVRRFVFMTFVAFASLAIGWLTSHYGLSVALFANSFVGCTVALWSLKVLLKYRQQTLVEIQS